MPRGHANPLRQVANGRRVHLVASLEVLEQDRTELDKAKGRLAPGDDGVDARTVAVVGTDAAVAITVECRGITARPAVPLTGNQIDERRFLGLLHKSLSSLWGAVKGVRSGARGCVWARHVLGGSEGIRVVGGFSPV
jgi:hypothetical protein